MPNLKIRRATIEDLADIVALFYEDDLGESREVLSSPVDARYLKSFEEIQQQKGNEIYVAELEGAVIGVAQFTVISHLNRTGMKRAQIESVHVSGESRGKGIGKALTEHLLKVAKESGCGMVQLTSDETRRDAHRFYERFGFKTTHCGMKLYLK